MISNIEQQPGNAGSEPVGDVEGIFSAPGILSRASNSEYRPEQQQMAVVEVVQRRARGT